MGGLLSTLFSFQCKNLSHSYSYTKFGQLSSKTIAGMEDTASLKYFYDKDGTLSGREVGGVKQTYKYDKIGQLLAVIDSTGKEIEKYVYDPAGNILSKTVAGKTTTYTYDKANQLVSSTNADGKVTRYEYDAAGRMIKEGEKTFSYGWLDKVMQVVENGNIKQSYSYDISGQLATADYGDSKETFLWDGLALLSRNNLKYVNEPAVTGGNPILAGDKILFDDMLGNTLGVKDGEKFSAINRDAFGELKPGENPNLAVNFFTGKPEVDGLGYSFLFRNYRADLGKWQTTDPLGYPDGWNNLAYVNNQTFLIDPLGLNSFDDYNLSRLSSKDYGFVKHFYTGNGTNVTLSQMGVFSDIKKEIDKQGILDRFKKQTGDVARSIAERTDLFPFGGHFSNSFRNSYDFGNASYSIGKATLSGVFSGNISTYLLEDGKKMYGWSGTVTLTFSDEFTDPLSIIEFVYGSSTSPTAPDWLVSIANLGGDSFHVGEVWEITISGTGIIE